MYALTVALFAEYKDLFWWFGHMWRHEQPHKFTLPHLQDVMELNKKFAQVVSRYHGNDTETSSTDCNL